MNVDIIPFWEADAPQRFAASCRTTGFAILRLGNGDQGIYQRQIIGARDENIAFLERASAEEKMRLLFLNDRYKDAGWFGLGSEGKTDGPLNLLEYLHHRKDRVGVDFIGWDFPNSWGVFNGVFRLNAKVSQWLLAALPPERQAHFANMLSHMDEKKRSVVRFLKYYPTHPFDFAITPMRDPEDGQPVWNDAHEDANWLTFIPLQTRPGLQLKDRSGQWHNIPWVDGGEKDEVLIVVNVGDCLSVASGGRLALCKTIKNPDGTENKLGDPLFHTKLQDQDSFAHMWRDGFYHTDRKLRVVEQGFYPSTTHRVLAGTEVRYSMPIFIHLNGWVDVEAGAPWIAYDKMRGYVRNKEAQRAAALAAIEQNLGMVQPASPLRVRAAE